VLPGGVNSPVRAFGAVGGTPRFAARGDGAWIEDVDGRRYLDLVQSWGALLFGHAREEVVRAATEAAALGTSFGAPTEGEVALAAAVVDAVPGIDEVRFVSSGTEAAMSAVRLARGATGRPAMLKFEGCYHGHSDGLLARAGSGVATFGLPDSAGVTEGAARDTLVAPYNDLDAAAERFDGADGRIAAVILEPVAANMGVCPPSPGFLEGLRALCDRHGSLLVFDEVITGFRLGRGGAQKRFGVRPDLTCLGKVLGGGLPLAAFGGRRDVMEQLAPNGPVYQAGTLSGNPVAVAAGLATLRLIEREDPYAVLEATADGVIDGLTEAFSAAGIAHTINRSGALFSAFFAQGPVADLDGARAADHGRYARFFHAMLDRGVWLPPSGYEAWFVSTAMGPDEVELACEAARGAAEEVARVSG